MPATKIPKHAKRVFKGVIFDVYQWPQKMFDGSIRTFEVTRRQDTVIIIPVMKNRKIAITKQKQPAMDWFYSVPAGRLDIPGEKPRQTAIRELREEAGLKPGKMKLWKTLCHRGKVMFNIYYFIAQDCIKVGPQELDGGEKIKIEYVSFEDFLKLSSNPRVYESELTIDLLRARLDSRKKVELKKAIYN